MASQGKYCKYNNFTNLNEGLKVKRKNQCNITSLSRGVEQVLRSSRRNISNIPYLDNEYPKWWYNSWQILNYQGRKLPDASVQNRYIAVTEMMVMVLDPFSTTTVGEIDPSCQKVRCNYHIHHNHPFVCHNSTVDG